MQDIPDLPTAVNLHPMVARSTLEDTVILPRHPRVVQLFPNQIDDAPVANAGADKTATIGSAVSFDGSASTDDKGIASYSWDFDASNGITSEATGKTATKTYTTAGTYTVTLTVTDTSGQKSTDTLNVVVSEPQPTTQLPGSVSYCRYL